MKFWVLLVLFLITIPVLAVDYYVDYYFDVDTQWNISGSVTPVHLIKDYPFTMLGHTVKPIIYNPQEPKFYIESDGVGAWYTIGTPGSAFSGQGTLTVTSYNAHRYPTITVNSGAPSYTINCGRTATGTHTQSKTFTADVGGWCTITAYGKTWFSQILQWDGQYDVTLPRIEVRITDVYALGDRAVKLDVSTGWSEPVDVYLFVDQNTGTRTTVTGSTNNIFTGLICNSPGTHHISIYGEGTGQSISTTVDCVNDFDFGIFNYYGWEDLQSDSPDLLINEVDCGSSIRVKVEGSDEAPLLNLYQYGVGSASSINPTKNGDLWEYNIGLESQFAEVRLELPTGTVRSYCYKNSNPTDYTIGFDTDLGTMNWIRYGTKTANICANLPSSAWGEIVVLATKPDVHPVSSGLFTSLTNEMCTSINLEGIEPQKLKAVLMMWGGVNKPLYLSKFLTIRPMIVHVFRGGCTMCKVGLNTFPQGIDVVEHKPTDLDYIPKMLEYGVDFAPALVIPGEGKEYTYDDIVQKTPQTLDGLFKIDRGNEILFIPSYRSFNIKQVFAETETRTYQLTGGEVLTYLIPGDQPKLGIIPIIDNLPRGVTITPDRGNVVTEGLGRFGPVCNIMNNICKVQGCSYDCQMYELEANGTVQIMFSGLIEGMITENIVHMELPSLDINITAPDALLTGDVGTLIVRALDNGKPADVVVVVESRGIGITANKVAPGYYSLSVGPGDYNIAASKLGYNTYILNKKIREINPLNFTFSMTPGRAGRTAKFDLNIKNVGRDKFYGVVTKVEIPELGVRSVSTMDFDIDPELERTEHVEVLIPANAWPGDYQTIITVGNTEFSNEVNQTLPISSDDLLINLMKLVGDVYDRIKKIG